MYDQDSKGISYTAGFFMVIAFAIAGLMMATVFSGAIWSQATGLDLQALSETGFKAEHKNVLRMVQVITALLGFLLPALVTAHLLNRRPLKLMGFQGRFSAAQVGLGILILAAAIFVASGLSDITRQLPIPESWQKDFAELENDYNRQVGATLGLNTIPDLLIALVVMAFLPALCEEALFRGGMQNFLARGTGKPWLAIVVSSILFSLAHFSFYGFLSRVVLGMALGVMFQYSGRLWISIIAHFLNNGLLIVLLYVNLQRGGSVQEMMESNKGNWLGLLAIPVFIVLIYAFKRASAAIRSTHQ